MLFDNILQLCCIGLSVQESNASITIPGFDGDTHHFHQS